MLKPCDQAFIALHKPSACVKNSERTNANDNPEPRHRSDLIVAGQVWHHDSSGGFRDKSGAKAHVRITHPMIMPWKPSGPSSEGSKETEDERRAGHDGENVEQIK